jgi:hypothetical protein
MHIFNFATVPALPSYLTCGPFQFGPYKQQHTALHDIPDFKICISASKNGSEWPLIRAVMFIIVYKERQK